MEWIGCVWIENNLIAVAEDKAVTVDVEDGLDEALDIIEEFEEVGE